MYCQRIDQGNHLRCASAHTYKYFNALRSSFPFTNTNDLLIVFQISVGIFIFENVFFLLSHHFNMGVGKCISFFRNDVMLQWKLDLVLVDTCAIYNS